MNTRVSPGQGGSTRSVSGSASIEAQIAALRQKLNQLISERERIRAGGDNKVSIAAIERRIEQIEERIRRLEEQKTETAKSQREQREKKTECKPETKTEFDVIV